ncbi:hypothetical protein ACFYU8_18410 [Brevibacillus sp. NPDC003359]|uniref:hypothetical protein n=1 Tax=unclassified Brevibacillus TaxID=2684853 RepID=UPI0036B1CD9B
MSVFKWTVAFMFIFIPLLLLLSEYGLHNVTKSDADTATRQAATYALKMGVQKGSLRDADLYPQKVSTTYDQAFANEGFEKSMTMLQKDSSGQKMYVINPAERDERVGISKSPPMVAIRSNVVRESLMRTFLGQIISLEPRYVIQTQKIAILEWKETY